MSNFCEQCGMACHENEYHPYAACLMHMACRNGDTVRANLEAVIEHGKVQMGREAAQNPELLRIYRQFAARQECLPPDFRAAVMADTHELYED